VADRAIGSDQDQKYVVVVQADGLTKFQKVVLGPIADGLRVIQSGLQGDETVVVEGIGKVRPNSKVSAEQTDMNKFATEQLAMEPHINARNTVNADNTGKDKNRLSAAMPNHSAANGKHE
jgi:hypothetical protein